MPRKLDLTREVNNAVKLLQVENNFRGNVPEDESEQRTIVRYFYDRLRVGKGNDFISVEDAMKERIYRVAENLVNKAHNYIRNLSEPNKEVLRRVSDAMEGKDGIDSICIAAENVQLEPRVEHALKRAIEMRYGKPSEVALKDVPF